MDFYTWTRLYFPINKNIYVSSVRTLNAVEKTYQERSTKGADSDSDSRGYQHDSNRGRSEGSLFNSNYTEMQGRALLLSLDCSTLPLICTLYCWVLSKEISSTIFKVFGMTRPGIEPRSPGPLANSQRTIYKQVWLNNKDTPAMG